MSTNPVAPANPAPAPNATADPQTVLGRQVLTILAIVSFALAVILLSIGTFVSTLINTPISRMCLISLMSLSLTTFAWVFYPHVVEAHGVRIPFLQWEVTGFAGPLLLFVLTLGVLHLLFPNPQPPPIPASRYYVLNDPGDPTPAGTFRFDGKKTHQRLLMVKDSGRAGDGLIGFVALFETPDPFTVKLSNAEAFFNEQTVTFKPGATNGTVSLTLPK